MEKPSLNKFLNHTTFKHQDINLLTLIYSSHIDQIQNQTVCSGISIKPLFTIKPKHKSP